MKQYRGYTTHLPTVVRSAEAGAEQVMKLRGYAALFGLESGLLSWGFVEVIEAGAFDGCLEDDVRCLFNHDSSMILGRTKSKTLKLGVDEKGLWYECTLPDTQLGRDLAASLERGDIDQSSFQFTLNEEDSVWEKQTTADGFTRYKRTIKKVARLYDVAPVTFPAYEETDVYMRSMAAEAEAQWAKKIETEVAPAALVVDNKRHELRRKQLIIK
jgi:hypothetical protein